MLEPFFPEPEESNADAVYSSKKLLNHAKFSINKYKLLSLMCVCIELYIRTRGRTGDAACTNATGPQDDKRAILYAR